MMLTGLKFEMIEARCEDSKELGKFIESAWREAGPNSLGWTGATEDVIRDLESEKYLTELLSDPNVKVFLTKENGRIVGFATNRRIDDGTVELAGLIIIQDMLGKGHGSALLAKAKSWSVEHGFKKMTVKTEQFNERAISFYKSRGFSETERKSEDVSGTKIDIVVLDLPLG